MLYTVMNAASRLIREEDGQDLIEYGILGAFISVIALLTIKAIGPLVETLYQAVEVALT
jgi:Flp pilus assembly pilin Flp